MTVAAQTEDCQQQQHHAFGSLDIFQHKWIFVGGKGGVGKTSVSSSIAHVLSEKFPQEKVLLISTDPAHNLSDVFNQQFINKPRPVNGKSNLDVIEMDPSSNQGLETSLVDHKSQLNSMLESMTGETDVLSLLPGVDEVSSILHVLEYAKESEYNRLIFDTAPTGHTLRLLHLPLVMSKAIVKLQDWLKNSGIAAVRQMGQLISPEIETKVEEFTLKVDEMKVTLDKLVAILKDGNQSQFVCVAIPEQLSIYENERLIQKLDEDEITPIRNIVVNRVDLNRQQSHPDCGRCGEKFTKLVDNLKLINELYVQDEDVMYNVIFTPMINYEIRGLENLDKFSRLLFDQECADRVHEIITKK